MGSSKLDGTDKPAYGPLLMEDEDIQVLDRYATLSRTRFRNPFGVVLCRG